MIGKKILTFLDSFFLSKNRTEIDRDFVYISRKYFNISSEFSNTAIHGCSDAEGKKENYRLFSLELGVSKGGHVLAEKEIPDKPNSGVEKDGFSFVGHSAR